MGKCFSRNKSKQDIPLINKLVEKASSTILITSVYKFQSTIGHGTFGTVKKAVNLKNHDQKVAIKTIPKNKITSSAKRLRYEIDILLTLDHPNIIKCYESFEDNENIHIVMEHLPGGELIDVFPAAGPMEEEISLMYARSMLMAVNHIHKLGIVHRDLKPENFLFGLHKHPNELKLVDFGLSNKFSNKFERLHSTVGTPFYIAPEVLSGSYTSKCDLWSIGVILFIMLSGDIPFYAESVPEVFKRILSGKYSMGKSYWDRISEETKHLVTRLLCLNIHDRLSADEALMHPVIFSIPKSLSVDLNIIEKLKEYSKKNFLVKCFGTAAARFIGYEKITEEKKIFSVFDRNLTGVLGVIEICDTLEDHSIQYTQKEIIETMDKIGVKEKGKIFFSEFIYMMVSAKRLEESDIRLGFECFDRERTGKINSGSVVSAFNILGTKIEPEQAEKMIKEIESSEFIDFFKFKSLI